MLDLSPETEALARQVADAQSTSVDSAVRAALEACARSAGIATPADRRRRDPSPKAAAERRTRIDRIVREIAAMPLLDQRSVREIMDDVNAV